MKRILKSFLVMLSILLVLTACGKEDKDPVVDNGDDVTISFWAAPNPTQEKFWKEVAAEFEAENENIKVEVSQMKETPSSEASIQTAIVSDTAPTMSENINRSFGAQLAGSEVLAALNEFDGYDALLDERNMKGTIEPWALDDGNQYVLPSYSNPILFGWRIDILEELGFDEAPETYSEALEVGEKLKEMYPDKVLWAKGDLGDPTAWMRWFDFFPNYNASSTTADFVVGNELTVDDEAGIELMKFMKELSDLDLLISSEVTDPFENGDSIMSDIGPWTFPNWEEQFPEFKYEENYILTRPLVNDTVQKDDVETYADAKGIVIFNQATEEEQAAAFKFLEFVYGDTENDLNFLEITNLIPAIDDAAVNPVFDDFFAAHPQLKVYAEAVADAIPPMAHEDFNEIQEFIGTEAWNPVIRGEKEGEEAWMDMKDSINDFLEGLDE